MLLIEPIEEGTGFVRQRPERRDEAPPLICQRGSAASFPPDLPMNQREPEVLLCPSHHLPGLAVSHPHLAGGAPERPRRFDQDEEPANPDPEDRLATVLKPDSPAEAYLDGFGLSRRGFGSSGQRFISERDPTARITDQGGGSGGPFGSHRGA